MLTANAERPDRRFNFRIYRFRAAVRFFESGIKMTNAESGNQDPLNRFFAPEIRAWRGQADIATVFWGYGVLFSCVLAALHVLAYDPEHLLIQQALIVFSALYTVWILVAIWRSATLANSFWGNLAQWLTVAWGLNATFVLIFLQFDLLMRFIQG